MEMDLISMAMQSWWQSDVLFYCLQLVTSEKNIQIAPHHTGCVLDEYLALMRGWGLRNASTKNLNARKNALKTRHLQALNKSRGVKVSKYS